MSSKIRIDHFITSSSRSLQDTLDFYEQLGFIVSPPERTMRHQPGLRTGFIYLGSSRSMDYLEFLTVEDRATFEAAPQEKKRFKEGLHAQSLGIRVQNMNELYEELISQGSAVKEVWSKKPEGAPEDSPLIWSFCSFEKEAAKLGAFFVEYLLSRPAQTEKVYKGENGIFALGGVLVSEPASADFVDRLRKDCPSRSLSNSNGNVRLGCHEIHLETMESLRVRFDLNQEAASLLRAHPELSLAGAVLYTENIDETEKRLAGRGKPMARSGKELLLLPTEFDGLIALVKERPLPEWQAIRESEAFAF